MKYELSKPGKIIAAIVLVVICLALIFIGYGTAKSWGSKRCKNHLSFCKKCISQEETCRACNGSGKWQWLSSYVSSDYLENKCELCSGTGKIYAPGKTYCPECNGLWDKYKNCTHCDHGLVPCPSHNTDRTICPNCGTVDGIIVETK